MRWLFIGGDKAVIRWSQIEVAVKIILMDFIKVHKKIPETSHLLSKRSTRLVDVK